MDAKLTGTQPNAGINAAHKSIKGERRVEYMKMSIQEREIEWERERKRNRESDSERRREREKVTERE